MIETLEINLHRSKQIYEMNDKEVKEYKLKTKNIGNYFNSFINIFFLYIINIF